jgi:uncharacterized protein with WD repeat
MWYMTEVNAAAQSLLLSHCCSRRRVNNGVSMEWGPDGRHLMTATLAPRLRVDNGFCIYRHDGTLIAQQKLQELLEAVWLPAPAGTHSAQKTVIICREGLRAPRLCHRICCC